MLHWEGRGGASGSKADGLAWGLEHFKASWTDFKSPFTYLPATPTLCPSISSPANRAAGPRGLVRTTGTAVKQACGAW